MLLLARQYFHLHFHFDISKLVWFRFHNYGSTLELLQHTAQLNLTNITCNLFPQFQNWPLRLRQSDARPEDGRSQAAYWTGEIAKIHFQRALFVYSHNLRVCVCEENRVRHRKGLTNNNNNKRVHALSKITATASMTPSSRSNS